MAKMTASANHSIKQVALAEEEVNRSGQEEEEPGGGSTNT